MCVCRSAGQAEKKRRQAEETVVANLIRTERLAYRGKVMKCSVYGVAMFDLGAAMLLDAKSHAETSWRRKNKGKTRAKDLTKQARQRKCTSPCKEGQQLPRSGANNGCRKSGRTHENRQNGRSCKAETMHSDSLAMDNQDCAEIRSYAPAWAVGGHPRELGQPFYCSRWSQCGVKEAGSGVR
jgi:hypothetical protein